MLPAAFFPLSRQCRLGRDVGCCLACEAEGSLRLTQRSHVVPDEKRCSRCRQERPAADFCVARRLHDGLNAMCKNCMAAYLAARKAPLVRVAVSSKRCHKCGEVKPAADFSNFTRTADGLHHACKACVALDRRQRSNSRLQKGSRE